MKRENLYFSNKSISASLVTMLFLILCVERGQAQQGIVDVEVARRTAQTQESDTILREGRDLYKNGKYHEALLKYKESLKLLPKGDLNKLREESCNKHIVVGSIQLAKVYRKLGKLSEAEELLNQSLKIDPKNKAAQRELNYLSDPLRTNFGLTGDHSKNVDLVIDYLNKAESSYNLGNFNDAIEYYYDVLRIDKWNKAARKGMERVAEAKQGYSDVARKETRRNLLEQVSAAWAGIVPQKINLNKVALDQEVGARNKSVYLKRKLSEIVLPVVDFENVSLEQAIDVLRQRARELDTIEPDVTRKGINFIVNKPKGTANAVDSDDVEGFGEETEEAEEDKEAFASKGNNDGRRVSELKMQNIPLEIVLKHICEQTGMRYKVGDYAVQIVPIDGADTGGEMFMRSFKVPPNFLTLIDSKGSEASDEGGGLFDDDGPKISGGKAVIDLLRASGLPFPEGSTASFSKANSMLNVRNTSNALDSVAAFVEEMATTLPMQVRMSTKFVEVREDTNDELSFDWVVAPVGIRQLNLGGGSIGNGAARTADDFGNNGYGINGLGGGNVRNIVTGGNRTGDFAVSKDSIDSFLANPNRLASGGQAAPGIMSLTGLFNSTEVQMVMRGLSQKKGADVMTAPAIISRSGEEASIELIREFMYPTEYLPPEIPKNVTTYGGVSGGLFGDSIGGGGGGSASLPVTPATPTAFETKNTGVLLSVQPTIGEDKYTIDLAFQPEIVEFEGFINYGSPILSSGSNSLGRATTIVLTENRIEMPVFSSRSVKTGLTIYDGHTIAIGGLMTEQVQEIEDKVPVLGDLPLIGRLFQSKAESHIKSNLVIFVTVDIIDATGSRISGREQTNGNISVDDVLTGSGSVGDNLLPTQ